MSIEEQHSLGDMRTESNEDAFILRNARGQLRYAQWWLLAFVLFSVVAVYIESASPGYIAFSIVFGIVWFALTIAAWRKRSDFLTAIIWFVMFFSHYFFCIFLQPPHKPRVAGIFISGVTLFLILLIGRSRIYRFCRIEA